MSDEIEGRRIEYERPWLAVEAKDVRREGAGSETFYSVRTHDYAVVLAVTGDGRIPLVRQFRPAIELFSLELPSGLIEDGETPEETVRRELVEETGCEVGDEVLEIGQFHLDSGRMQTTEWAFFAPGARVVAPGPSGEEADLEVVFVTAAELRDLVLNGEFRMAAHLAVIGAALYRGLLP
jgi:ADP-ribose pyrophosphatase